jgi:hypothetical protein
MKFLIVFGLLPVLQGNPLQYGTRQMTNTVISTLEALAQEQSAATTFEKIFNKDNTCLNSIGEAIEALKQSSDLLAAAEGDLQALNSQVESLMGKQGEVEALKGTAAIFRTLQPLVEKLSRSVTSSKVCSSSPDNTLAYLRGLAVVLHEFSYDDTVAPNKQARDMFHKSGNMVSVVVSFLSQLQSQARNFGSVCNNDKSSVTKGVSAVGDMIGSLSDMFSSVGNYKAGVEVRKGADFTSKIAAQIPRLNALNIGFLDCSMKDFNEAAQTMEDIASLVEDIGLERLSNDLGFDF